MNQDTAERIASALERIADALENRDQGQPKAKAKSAGLNAMKDYYLRALRENSDQLEGRMDLRQIAFATGLDVQRSQYKAFGMALTEYGAVRGISSNKRYYVFNGAENG